MHLKSCLYKNVIKTGYLIILNLFIYTNTYSKNYFTYYTINEGLSQNMVDCIIKDNDQFMWIGTWNGLNRFDGYDFKTFKHSDTYTNSLPDNFIHSLYVDSFNNIWITSFKGLSVYINHKNTFKRFNFVKTNLNIINSDNNGNLWIGGDNVIEIIKPLNRNGDMEILTEKYVNKDNVKPYLINDIFFDSNNMLWLATNSGIYSLNKKNKKMIEVNAGKGSSFTVTLPLFK